MDNKKSWVDEQREEAEHRFDDDWRERHRFHSSFQSEDCNHDMEYSSCAGVIGGRCKKCGYSTT